MKIQLKSFCLNYQNFKKSYFSFKSIFSLVLILITSLSFAQKNIKIAPSFNYLIDRTQRRELKTAIPELYKIDVVKGLNPSTGIYEDGYICIIYTKFPDVLKANGIAIQSTYPTYVTAWVTLAQIPIIADLKGVEFIAAPQLIMPNNDISVGSSGASLLHAGKLNNTVYKGDGVIVAVVDSGIDWDHPDFRNSVDQTKSRILRIWDQTLTPISGEVSPTGFNYGVEYTQTQINNEIDGSPAGYVREKDTNGHGTHVAGTAAGNGAALSTYKYTGLAPNADIVVVKGGNGSFSSINIINSLTYLQNLATTLGKPIVVNMSLGGQSSSHDGTDPQEIAVDAFTDSAAGRIVVIAAGNDNGSNIHKQNSLANGGNGTVSIVVPTASASTSTSVFQYTCYANDASAVSATITAPGGTTATVNAGSSGGYSILGGLATVNFTNSIDSGSGDRMINVYLVRANTTANVAGTWTLTLTNASTNAITIDGWLNYKGDDFATTTITSADSNYLVGTPGCATKAITVGSYMAKLDWTSSVGSPYSYPSPSMQDNISSFSSIGPRRDNIQKPDITANGQAVVSCLSSDSGLTNTDPYMVVDGLYRVEQGTSMATPEVAGCVALLLQINKNATYSQIKAAIMLTATKDAFTTAANNNTWGNGKIDIFKAASTQLYCNTLDRVTYSYDAAYTETNNYEVNVGALKVTTRFTPATSGQLGGVYFKTGSTVSLTSFTIEVRTNTAGVPGTLLNSLVVTPSSVSKYSWNYYDLSSLNIAVTSGTDYFIVLVPGASSTFSIGKDPTSVGRSFYYNSAAWIAYSDFRIRSVVYTTGNLSPSISLSSVAGTNAQTKCVNTAITNITYATVGATGATFSGLPAGVAGVWASNVVTISGTPSVAGTYNYTVTLTAGCGTVAATGTIIVNTNTATLSSAGGTNAQTKCLSTAITDITYTTTGATGATFSGLPTGVTGTWSANVVTISGTPSVAGTYNYTITLTGGCLVTVSGSIIVNALAIATPGGPNTVCQSASPVAFALAGSSIGGSATTGAWSIVSGGGTLSSTAQTATPATVTYTPVANYSGTVILRLSSNFGIGCSAAAADRTVNVNALATATSGGPNTVCQAASPAAFSLAGASVGGSATTGAWSIVSGGGTLSSTAQTTTPATVTYTPATNYSGTVTLRLTSNFGTACSLATADRIVNVNANIAASVSIVSNDADNIICSATSVTFTATPTNGGASPSYQWYIGTTPVGTNSATFISSTLTTGQVVKVVMTNSNICGTSSSATSNTITTTVNTSTTANSGGPNTVCQSASPAAFALAGASVGGSATTGAWSIVSGGGTLSSTAQTTTPATVTYTPAANYSGTVTLRLTSNFGTACSAAAADRVVNVLSQPILSANTGGALTVLTNNPTPAFANIQDGGIWSIVAGTGTASITINGVVTGLTAGTVSVVYTYNNGCGTATKSNTVTVIPSISGEISGNATICAGTSTQLSIALTGEGPWFGTLSDGTGFSGSDNPLLVTVTPTVTTSTYTISTLSSETATASAADMSGSAIVIVNQPKTETTVATSCGMYIWENGNHSDYMTSGTYSYTENCVEHILELTVNEPTIERTVATSCGMYIWESGNNSDYFETGTYSYTENCIVHILELTVNQPTTATTVATSCGMYIWPMNGSDYMTSGTYSYTENCVEHILELTVNQLATVLLSASASIVCPDTSVTISADIDPYYYCNANTYNTYYQQITHIAFGSIDNDTSNDRSTTNIIHPFNGSTTTVVQPGQIYPLTVSTVNNPADVAAWIDYNRNGVYEASEYIEVFQDAFTGTVNVTIPSGATLGKTGMRVRSELGYNNRIFWNESCSHFTYGTTHDYTITIGQDVTNNTISWSSNPVDASLSNVNTASITTIPAVTTTYTATATSATGCSTISTVTVNVQNGVIINTQPQELTTTCQGVTTAFSVAATGVGLTYQWYKEGQPLTDGGTINGATSATLNMMNPTPNDNGVYTVLVHPICGDDVISTMTTLLVNPTPTVEPIANQTYCQGMLTSVIPLTGGPSNVTYTIEGGEAIGLANSSGTTIPSFTAVAGTATITVTPNANGCAGPPTTFTITVNPRPTVDLTSSSSTAICPNTAVSISAAIAYTDPTASYCNSSSYSPQELSITNVTFRSINSDTSNDQLNSPNTHQETTVVQPGETYTLSVNANSLYDFELPFVGAWIDYNSNGIYETSEYTEVYQNAITGSVNITIPTNATNGKAGMRVRSDIGFNHYNSQSNAEMACSVFEFGTTQDYTITIGEDVPAYTISWSSNPVDVSLSTVNTASIAPSPAVTTSYTATVTPATGCSTTTRILVDVLPAIAITSQPVDSFVCDGENATFSIVATGEGLTFQWYKDGQPLTVGGTSALLNIVGSSSNDNGVYTVIVHSQCGNEVLSSVATLTVNKPTTETTVATSCGMYIWESGNHSDYMTSGTYSYDTEDCVHHVLELTVNQPTTETTIATSCGMYIWESGNHSDYMTSGTYSYTENCVEHILELTVNQPTTETTVATSCGMYIWESGNNSDYFETGTYSYTENCVTHILELTVNQCNSITFDANGGSGTMSNQMIAYNASATLTANAFTRSGYTFEGWAASSGGSVAYADGASYVMSTIQAPVVLYAKWTQVYVGYMQIFIRQSVSMPRYAGVGTTFTLDVDSSDSVENVKQKINDRTSVLVGNLVLVFAGITLQDGFILADYNITPESTVHVFAVHLYPATSVAVGGTTSVLSVAASGADYTNKTVSTTSDFTGTLSLLPSGEVSIQNASPVGTYVIQIYNPYGSEFQKFNLTVYNDSYTVLFNANGGTGTILVQPIDANTSANLIANTFTRTGYTFVGWNTASNGSGTSFSDGSSYTMIAAPNITLYAQWLAINYIVTFDANSGTGMMSDQTIAFNATANLTSNTFTRWGYSFAGWNTAADGSGSNYADHASYLMSAAANVTLHAQWQLLQSPGGLYQIFVRQSDSMPRYVGGIGTTIAVDVDGDNTIGQIRQYLADLTLVPAGNLVLFFAGRILEDGYILADYYIDRESTVHVSAVHLYPATSVVAGGSTSVLSVAAPGADYTNKTVSTTSDFTGTLSLLPSGEVSIQNASPVGTYLIQIANNYNDGSLFQSFNLTVYNNPTGIISGNSTICAGTSTQLSIALTGEGPWFGTLSDGTGFSGSDNPLLVPVTPTATTTYMIATLSSETATASATDLSGSAEVMVNQPTTETTIATSCGMYIWETGNHSDYMTSGTYSYIENCVEHILELTVNQPTTETTVATSCGMYIWETGNHSDYMTSGTYSYDTEDCVHHVLELTVNQLTTETTVATSCGMYIWETGNHSDYMTSGTYSYDTEDCVHHVLELTVIQPTTETIFKTSCDSYSWNGTTYTATGIFTGTTKNCITEKLDLTIRSFAFIWSGTSGTTDWNTPGNWYCGVVPNSGSDVYIAAAIKQPTLTTNVAIHSLTIDPNASLTVQTGSNLTVTNFIHNSGFLTIANNANLIQVDNVTNTGNAIVKRNSSPLLRLDYTLWCSPVTKQKLLDFSPATVASRFFDYATSFGTYGAYNVVENPSTTNFAVGKGYLIRVPNNANATKPTAYSGVFTGVPINGDVPVSLSYVDANHSYNLVGNPYPSPITISTFLTDNALSIESTLYFWRKTNGVPGSAYCTLNNGTFVTNDNDQSVDPNGIIQTGQGFFVVAKPSATSLTFKNGQRIANTAGQFFKTKQAASPSRIWLNASNLTGSFSQMAVNYTQEATLGLDSFDGKYINDSPIALTSIINNEEYTIQGRPTFDPADVVALNFKTDLAGNYTIGLDHSDGVFALGQDIYLIDSKMGTETNLKTDAYTFAAATGTDNSRFTLKYQKTLKVDSLTFNENTVTVYKNNGVLHIKSGINAINTIKVFDLDGRLIAQQNQVNANSATIENLRANEQVLIVQVTSEDNKVVNKKVIN